MTTTLQALLERLPEEANDVRQNLPAVLEAPNLTVNQRWGVALACAYAARNPALKAAVLQGAQDVVGADTLSDARGAAVMMAQNNVYYGFRHLVERESYAQLRPNLRMSRLGRIASDKVDFELMLLAVSTIGRCGWCVQFHERALRELGATEAQIHDAIRIASAVQGVAVALEL